MRQAINHLKQADPVLCEIIERVGPYRIQHTEPDFEAVARSIVFQQLSGSSARAIFGRLKEALGSDERMAPESILSLPLAEARNAGLSQQKANYLGDLAKKTQAGVIDFARMQDFSDQQVIEHLTVVKGVGVWTAQMFLMFALRRPDVLATGDLGVRSAVRKAYRLRSLPAPARVEKLGTKWRPYRSVACWYLWRSLDTVLVS